MFSQRNAVNMILMACSNVRAASVVVNDGFLKIEDDHLRWNIFTDSVRQKELDLQNFRNCWIVLNCTYCW